MKERDSYINSNSRRSAERKIMAVPAQCVPSWLAIVVWRVRNAVFLAVILKTGHENHCRSENKRLGASWRSLKVWPAAVVPEMVWQQTWRGMNNLIKTYYTHRLTQRSLGMWLQVGRIVAEWLPKQGLYYRDPRISDTRRPVLPPGRAESGSWPVAQIAIISSITCSTESHLGALIVEPWLYCRD